MDCKQSKPKAKSLIPICTKRLPTRRAIGPKKQSSARPGEVTGLRIVCCDLRASLFPAARRSSEHESFRAKSRDPVTLLHYRATGFFDFSRVYGIRSG